MSGHLEVSRLKSRLDAVFDRVPTTSDIEIQADFARYLCVLVSGFFENAIVALILDYSERRSAPEVAQFIERQLDHWTNPNAQKIVTLLGHFRADWRIQVDAYLVDEKKEAINSLVSLRHKIVHGETVGTSLSQVKAYYKSVLEVVMFIEKITK